ncbi:MAG TPA: S41 family peptidase [Acidobacteriota bacterium]|nr:S41 family peptidase [Acidobacteriota bacterium]HNT17965.1 S41 family peptidase [Acidobacteriota bacterium]HPA27789.1 S41 family peptidase [Acidobacteriota bacterium]HQO18932.1 S41 family peptidase [Acidobacteriota bacterium]HQQ46408.1 S41 family peptidase [Acidobacteriota bacterium]
MRRIFWLALLFIIPCVAAAPGEPAATSENWNLFKDVYSLILDTYVEPKTPEQLLAGALQGLAGATGPECGYIPGSKLEEAEAAEKNRCYLPLYITKDGGFASVIAPFLGEDGEIEQGDLLRFINGKSVFDMNFPQLISAMKGKEGEQVSCGFIKKDTFKPYEKKLAIRKPVPPVFHELKEKGAAVEIPCLEAEIEKTLLDKISGTRGRLVIDLRGCASADEERAVAVAGMLFGKGTLKLSTKNGMRDISYSGEGAASGKKVTVVIDNTTARGGELLALAAKSSGGYLIGGETYGFCAMHEKVTLKNGDALVILTGYFLDGEGKEIKDNPLKPDKTFDISDNSRKDDYYMKALTKDPAKE